jgi:hypothetical protein
MLEQLQKLQKEIKHDDKNRGKYYVIEHPTKFTQRPRKYMRISQFVNSFQPYDRFHGWYKHLGKQDGAENKSEEELIAIGQQKGEKIKESQAKKGTRKHKLIEDFYKKNEMYSQEEWTKKLENFSPFVNIFNPFLLETRVFYENSFNKYVQTVANGKLVGLAGTFDGFGEIDGKALSFEKKGEPIYDGIFRGVVDWKHPRKPKYPMTKYYNNVTYPLIAYGLQLACYLAAINQRTNNYFKLNKAIVCLAPEESKTCYPYYFSPLAIKWFWENIKKMLVACAYNEKKLFDYRAFEHQTYEQGLHGQRLYFR